MNGLPVGRALRARASGSTASGSTAAGSTVPGASDADGSIMIVLATDAPISDRNLARLAGRALGGVARTGAALSDGSGDYAVAFSTALDVRRRVPVRRPTGPPRPRQVADLANDDVSPLFLAAIEAAEEAILDALCLAQTMRGYRGRVVEALPLDVVRGLVGAFTRATGGR